MPRTARIVIPKVYHHVTQRGNNRQDVFFSAEDRTAYLKLLALEGQKHGMEVIGYCLMTNHVHLIVLPRREESLAKAIGRTHWEHTRRINDRMDRSGHLWHNRFYSCPLDKPHFFRAMRYLERNPVRAGLAEVAWQYPWSSAAAHVGGPDPSVLLNLAKWEKILAGTTLDWQDVLLEPDNEKELKRLRKHMRNGLPLGSDRFVARLESLAGRSFRPRPAGRPPAAPRQK